MKARSGRIVAELEREILDGKLPPGGRLPSEEKLCQRFDTSRTSVREALQQLRGRGLLRTLRGSGTYIANPSLHSLGSAIETYTVLAEEADFFELIDFRILIETESARLAAHHMGRRDLAEIRACLGALERAQGDRQTFATADIAFHLAIATASGNRIYETLLGALQQRCIAFAQANRLDDNWFGAVYQEHFEIAERIFSGCADAAAEAMRRHLLFSRRKFVDIRRGSSD